MQPYLTNESSPIKKRRLWVISEPYYPEETSTGYYLTRIAEGLAGDFDVKVICGQPTYSARGTIAPKHEVHKGVEIFRASGTTLDKNVIPLRLVNMITLGISVLINALRRFRPGDHILVVTTPPSMPFVAAIGALSKGASYTLLIHDNYPEILVATKKSRPGSLVVKSMSFFNRWLYKHASKIIVVGRDMRELLTRKTEGLDIPIVCIPNWAELESVEPASKDDNRMLGELGLRDKFVFLYAGNMGHPNDLESIVDAAGALRDREDVHFMFLGVGVKLKWLQERVSTLGLKNVSILDPRPRTEQNDFLNACDVGIVSLVENMIGVSMPSRTYNILAAGKPILAVTEGGSELAQVVVEEDVGWIVKPGSAEDLTNTILTILARPAELRAMGERARAAAVNRYSLGAALEKYKGEL